MKKAEPLVSLLGAACLLLAACQSREAMTKDECARVLDSRFCHLPEMEIIEGWTEAHFPMGGDTVVLFRLPKNKKPEEWLGKMVLRIADKKKDKAYKHLRVTPFRTVTRHRIEQAERLTDWYFIEYDPRNDWYKASEGWD